MKGQKKNRIKGVCFLISLLTMLAAGIICVPGKAAASAAAGGASAVSMEVSYGFNDMAKGDRYLRVTVLLNNQKQEDF